MKSRARFAITLAAISVVAWVVAGCGESDEETTGAQSGATQLEPVKDYLTEHSAELVDQVGLLQANADEYYALAESVDFDYDRLLAEHGDEVEQLLNDSKDVFVVANPAYEEMEGIVAGVPQARPLRRRHRRRVGCLDTRRRRLLHPDHARRRAAQTAGQPVLPHRDRALRHQPGAAGEGRRARRRRQRQGRVRRGAARRQHLQGDARRVRRTGEEPRRRRPGVRTDALRRAHLDRDHDADDERVLRGVEELALHRRR